MRELAIKSMANVIWHYPNGLYSGLSKYDMAEALAKDGLMSLPPADVREIIRCKDCKWKQGSECVMFADVRPFPDDFCSRAERI